MYLMRSTRHVYAVAGVAVVAAGVIATPVTAPLVGAHVPDIQLTAGGDAGGDAQDVVLDFVRHAETAGATDIVATPQLPGPPLSDLGEQQAIDVGNKLHDELGDDLAGIFVGQNQRMAETGAPLAEHENLIMPVLPGLNEVDSGIYAGLPLSSPGGILFELTEFAWALGLYFVPMPGSVDINGAAFNELFGEAVDTMYDDTADFDASANGLPTDVAVSGEAAISAWVLGNVKNPDASFFLDRLIDSVSNGDADPFLSNTGEVEVKGNPDDGWTLVSFDGEPVPQDPDLLTNLIVDVRDLITPPQTAAYDIFEAALTGDSTKIEDAFQEGLHNVGSALVQFPQSVFNDIGDALQNLGTDPGAAASDGTDSTLSDAWTSLF
jgi:hypothetical protein